MSCFLTYNLFFYSLNRTFGFQPKLTFIDHVRTIREDFFFILFYGGVIAMALIASSYLWFRRANAIAPDITSPIRLRRWTAAFFACMT